MSGTCQWMEEGRLCGQNSEFVLKPDGGFAEWRCRLHLNFASNPGRMTLGATSCQQAIGHHGPQLELCGAPVIQGQDRCPDHLIALKTPDRLKALEEDRKAVYGDPYICHLAMGMNWESILFAHDQELADWAQTRSKTLFPPHIVALMMAGFKIVRAAHPTFRQDSYDDGHVYLGFSERFRKGEQ